MSNTKQKTDSYSNISYATEPTKMVKFMRNCFIYQLFNFFKLNFKIMRIVAGGHS